MPGSELSVASVITTVTVAWLPVLFLSRIENGKRPPTEVLAAACDKAFPERRGWFCDWYQESRTWTKVRFGLDLPVCERAVRDG